MTKKRRWEKFLYHLRTKPATQQELADIFDVSDRTIRRWLLELEEQHKDQGIVLTKNKEPESGEFIYGMYSVMPKQKHAKRTHTYKLANDGSPYITIMIPDHVGYQHPLYGNCFDLLPWADVHWGHRSCNKEAALECIRRIKESDNCFTLFGADLTENSGRYTVGGGIYEQVIPPQQQQDEVKDIVQDVAHKAWMSSSGNHGYRSWKSAGLDPDLNIANAFDIPYFMGQYHIDVNWRENLYSLVGYHGKGKGGSVRGRVNALVETARLNEIAHCHIMFHLHHRMQVEFAVPMRNRKTNRLEDFISRAVLFGGFLNYYREYCDIGAMDKTFVGTYRLLFCEDGKIRVQEEDF